MNKRNSTGLKEEHQDHTPVQGAAATAEPVNRKEPRMVVADILPEGKENAMSAEALCSRLGLETVRELQGDCQGEGSRSRHTFHLSGGQRLFPAWERPGG